MSFCSQINCGFFNKGILLFKHDTEHSGNDYKNYLVRVQFLAWCLAYRESKGQFLPLRGNQIFLIERVIEEHSPK